MSSRYLKSLKLNGVIVGEYLGSDDQDEDVEAARDMLRAKIRPCGLPLSTVRGRRFNCVIC
jgi:hypothetical protein